jgi:hypothetical protein
MTTHEIEMIAASFLKPFVNKYLQRYIYSNTLL